MIMLKVAASAGVTRSSLGTISSVTARHGLKRRADFAQESLTRWAVEVVYEIGQ